jgi:phage-related baseplate assembly protein|tara:strand:- start:5556 stop:7397 length:1842 start_codon:yes stop_codon:yes gene_type:complete
MAVRRNINYINKEFPEFRNQLINYSQTYFPSTYTDFTDTSPGMMFIEQAAYVSDVLSFYLDNQIQENFMQYARQNDNLYDLAYMYGYKPKATGLSETTMEFFQQIPAIQVGNVYQPDYSYTVTIPANTVIKTQAATSVAFTIEDPVNFSVSSSSDTTEVSVAQTSNGVPTYYLLRKTRKSFSGKINTTSFSFGAPQEFATVVLASPNIAGVIDIVDSEGNIWYEVDYLAQDLVYDSLRNTNVNSPNTFEDSDAPFLLQTKNVQNRFATRFLTPTQLQIQFGSGNPANTTEEVIPNSMNVGLGLPFEQDKLTTAYSPTNFIFTNTYGVSPTNTTLTVRYYTGGGVASNVLSNTANSIDRTNILFNTSGLSTNTSNYIFNTIAANNITAASGGQDGDTIEEIRQNSISQFSTQLRNVTQDDYLVRALSMPAKYGVVSKALTQKPNAESANTTLDLYVLTNDLNNNLTTASDTLKTNLRTYINQYRMIGDTISIKDAFIINFGIHFEIITYPNFNSNEVIERCIIALKNYFLLDKWQINQPIVVPDLFVLLDTLDGVQTVRSVKIANIAGTSSNYSEWAYDMNGANQNGTIYPSLDPSIFELKFPDNDIKGRVVNL